MIISANHFALCSSSSITCPYAFSRLAILHFSVPIQVVMSGDGKIIGFQPTNRVAVNNWVSNPLAKELYEGQKLSPGKLSHELAFYSLHKG